MDTDGLRQQMQTEMAEPDQVNELRGGGDMSEVRESMTTVPLFVDLDGTLLRTDMLVETFFSAVRANPLNAIRVIGWLSKGRAYLKKQLAERYHMDVGSLPLNAEFVEFLRLQADRGRQIFLATASNRKIAEAIAKHLGFFAGIVASDGQHNLKGVRKLTAIRDLVAVGDFDYAGNGPEDIQICRQARKAIVVGPNRSLLRAVRETGNLEAHFPPVSSVGRSLLRAIRPQQWLKNILVFVPLLTAFKFDDVTAVFHAVLAFVGFSMVASATYILNDLLDLASDRSHPRKRLRPFAAGDVSVVTGLVTAVFLLGGGFAVSLLGVAKLALMLLAYLLLTASYSLYFKNLVLADAIVLAGLYTIRVLAGAIAVSVESSVWLLAFSAFVFFSLALVKRCAELKLMEAMAVTATTGRDYRVSDLSVLWPTGIAAGVGAVVVFSQYISSAEVAAQFGHPFLLWLICPCLGYWIGRMWIKTGRGEMHDDPLVYAATDKTSRLIVMLIVALFVAAS